MQIHYSHCLQARLAIVLYHTKEGLYIMHFRKDLTMQFRVVGSNRKKSNRIAFQLDLYKSNQIFHFDLFLIDLNRSK